MTRVSFSYLQIGSVQAVHLRWMDKLTAALVWVGGAVKVKQQKEELNTIVTKLAIGGHETCHSPTTFTGYGVTCTFRSVCSLK